jgi:DNA-binding transcriptional LysR family regulator
MTLHQLRVFAKVAELQSFTEAAKALRLTQPSISALIQELVGELRYKLFERRGIKMALTPEGKVLLRRTQQALAVLEGAKDEIAEAHGLKKGKLAVGGSALAAAAFLPLAIEQFKNRHPGVEVSLKIDRNDSLEKRLLEGDLDIAVLRIAPRSPLLIATPYWEEEVVAVALPKHPLVESRSVPLALIAKEPLIVNRRGSVIRDMVERRFTEAGLPFVARLEVDVPFCARDAIRSAVLSGLGIGFLSRPHIVEDLEVGRLKALKVPDLGLKASLLIAVHKKRQNTLVQAFSRFLKDRKSERKRQWG